MNFIKPMMAAPMPTTPAHLPPWERMVIEPGIWAVEEKYDGHRLETYVEPSGDVWCWSRNGLERAHLLQTDARAIPQRILDALRKMPWGRYDGELNAPGKRSYGVTDETNRADLVYVIFDVLELLGVSTVLETYDQRRAYLEEIGYRCNHVLAPSVRIAYQWRVASQIGLQTVLQEIWNRDGEGIILKRRQSRYSPGKRPKGDWIKFKKLQSTVITVTGFERSKGEIMDRGPFAVVVGVDANGVECKVKTRNDAELEKLNEEAQCSEAEFRLGGMVHPAIGRKLRIEYQELTPKGYRHPRWDRWEDE